MNNIDSKNEKNSLRFQNENMTILNKNSSFSTKNKNSNEILNPFEHDKENLSIILNENEDYPEIEGKQENSRDRSKSDLDNCEVNSKIDSVSSTIIVQEMDLTNFKTKPCKIIHSLHNPKHCPYYHSMLDRRRINEENFYSPEKCLFYEKGNCPNGDICKFAHNSVERVYHELQYKAKFCSKYLDNIYSCEYGSYCGFAHNENEVRTPLIHKLKKDDQFYMFYFKTVWCPFNHDHNKAACVYAHNCQDFRRRPNLFFYSAENCPNWKSEGFIKTFTEGCIHHEYCVLSHGWKEQGFHPLYYKTKPCPDELKCSKSSDCFYYHTMKEKRNPTNDFLYSSNQYLLPKNDNLIIWNNINDIQQYIIKMNKNNIHFSPNIIKRIKSINNQKVMTFPIISEFENDTFQDTPASIKTKLNNIEQMKSIKKSIRQNLPIGFKNLEREIEPEKFNHKLHEFADVFDRKDLNEEEKTKILQYKAPIFNQIKAKNETKETTNLGFFKPKRVTKSSPFGKTAIILKKYQNAAATISKMVPEFFKNDEKIIPILKIIQS